MIQRIQTVYLLVVVGLLITSMCFPLGYFTDAEALTYRFTAKEITMANTSQPTWGLFAILLLNSIVALATVFLYKNRKLQKRMIVFNSILLIGFYVVFGVFYYVLRNDLNAVFSMNWPLCLPLVCILLNYLAIRGINHDEALVKAVDRLR